MLRQVPEEWPVLGWSPRAGCVQWRKAGQERGDDDALPAGVVRDTRVRGAAVHARAPVQRYHLLRLACRGRFWRAGVRGCEDVCSETREVFTAVGRSSQVSATLDTSHFSCYHGYLIMVYARFRA